MCGPWSRDDRRAESFNLLLFFALHDKEALYIEWDYSPWIPHQHNEFFHGLWELGTDQRNMRRAWQKSLKLLGMHYLTGSDYFFLLWKQVKHQLWNKAILVDYVLLTEGEAVIVHDMEPPPQKKTEITREFHAQLITIWKWSEVFHLCKTEQEHKMVDGPGRGWGLVYSCYIFHFITRNYSNHSKTHRI